MGSWSNPQMSGFGIKDSIIPTSVSAIGIIDAIKRKKKHKYTYKPSCIQASCFYRREDSLFLLRAQTSLYFSLFFLIIHSERLMIQVIWSLLRRLSFFLLFFIKFTILHTKIYCHINSEYSKLQLPLGQETSKKKLPYEKVHIPLHRI